MEKNIPYTEIDNTNPINFYGLSKLKGEEVIDSGCKYLIIRTSGYTVIMEITFQILYLKKHHKVKI